ncbi:MAG: rhomboid family intramembrane serine protease [Alphaproteobacteria bacterium]|nr:rhomboid family intramembrane serine protease [Alphaproteobacteria bacterium]
MKSYSSGEGGSPYRLVPQPIINAPAVVAALLFLMAGVHLATLLLKPQLREGVYALFGFVPVSLSSIAKIPAGDQAIVLSTLVTHTFLHANFLHLAVNGMWFLAFGSFMARRQGVPAFLAFYFLCGVAGALSHFALDPMSAVPVVGASGAISGLMGGAARLIFSPGVRVFGTDALVTQVAPLTDRRVLGFAGVWTAVNVLFGVAGGFGMAGEGTTIAWLAHLGGFYCGLLTVPLFLRRTVVL